MRGSATTIPFNFGPRQRQGFEFGGGIARKGLKIFAGQGREQLAERVNLDLLRHRATLSAGAERLLLSPTLEAPSATLHDDATLG